MSHISNTQYLRAISLLGLCSLSIGSTGSAQNDTTSADKTYMVRAKCSAFNPLKKKHCFAHEYGATYSGGVNRHEAHDLQTWE